MIDIHEVVEGEEGDWEGDTIAYFAFGHHDKKLFLDELLIQYDSENISESDIIHSWLKSPKGTFYWGEKYASLNNPITLVEV